MARGWGGDSMEGYVERLIREAQGRGEFDDPAGSGRPIADLDRPHDENWWIRRTLREEQFTTIPPALALRRDVAVARQRIAGLRTEAEVRRLVEDLNVRIRHANATIVTGPPSSVWPLDVDREVARWRTVRGPDRPSPDPVDPQPDAPSRRPRWWRLRSR